MVNRGLSTFLDLFAGSGNFSVPLGAVGMAGTAVEWDAIGCAAHERTLQSYGFNGVDVICGDALDHAERLYLAGQRFDGVVIDPPRRGLRGKVAAVAGLANDIVVLVSCNADQFAADAAAFRVVSCGHVSAYRTR
jgi:23S rRNA (uracil1939-C5)-methyltransferase